MMLFRPTVLVLVSLMIVPIFTLPSVTAYATQEDDAIYVGETKWDITLLICITVAQENINHTQHKYTDIHIRIYTDAKNKILFKSIGNGLYTDVKNKILFKSMGNGLYTDVKNKILFKSIGNGLYTDVKNKILFKSMGNGMYTDAKGSILLRYINNGLYVDKNGQIVIKAPVI